MTGAEALIKSIRGNGVDTLFAHPDERVICVGCDGGFMFTMPKLATAVHRGINLGTLTFNDSRFGTVRHTSAMCATYSVPGSMNIIWAA